MSVDTVRTWRGRWSSLQSIPLTELSISERLSDIPRPGKPAEITGEQRSQIVALVCGSRKNVPSVIAEPDRNLAEYSGTEIAQTGIFCLH